MEIVEFFMLYNSDLLKKCNLEIFWTSLRKSLYILHDSYCIRIQRKWRLELNWYAIKEHVRSITHYKRQTGNPMAAGYCKNL